MPNVALPFCVAKGERLDDLLGRTYAIPTLILITEQPGLGVWQLAAILGRHHVTIAKCVDHLESRGLVTVKRNIETRGSNTTSVTPTDEGLRLAREVRALAERLHPNEDEAPRPAPGVTIQVLDRQGARDVLLALRERKHLTTPEFEAIVSAAVGTTPILYELARGLRLALHEADLIDWTREGTGDNEMRVIQLTKHGKRVADELNKIRALEEEKEQRLARIAGEVDTKKAGR